eukprot:1446216-Pyramimonas_sp.AAC.1
MAACHVNPHVYRPRPLRAPHWSHSRIFPARANRKGASLVTLRNIPSAGSPHWSQSPPRGGWRVVLLLLAVAGGASPRGLCRRWSIRRGRCVLPYRPEAPSPAAMLHKCNTTWPEESGRVT